MAHHAETRPCAVSGMFYPSNPAALRKQVYDLIGKSRARGRAAGTVAGMIVPHAGYMYSGPTAASAFAWLRAKSFATVVIVSPSHRDFFEGVSVYPGDAYETPLGRVPIDTALRTRLISATPLVTASVRGHGDEHAIEVQLPFLQAALGEFRLVPLVIGHQSRDVCFGLGEALAAVVRGENALLVASTDLSHYHPASVAEELDRQVIDRVAKFDYTALMSALDRGEAEACGGGPVVAVLLALDRLGAHTIEITHHCTSGDVTGDRGSVVGYMSAVATL